MRRLALRLLGGFAAHTEAGAPVAFSRRKAAALFAYLACSGRDAQPRDKLSALLWPDVSTRRARHSLRQALTSLREVLPAGALRVDDVAVALEPGVVDVDVMTFHRLVAEGTPAALAQAATVYAGDLLAGIDINDAAPFEEWLQTEREALHEKALTSLSRLLAWQRERQDTASALQTALRLLALDPLQEVIHRTVMRLQAAHGRRDAALRQYQACVDLLRRELGVEPEAETKRLYAEILQEREQGSSAVEEAAEDARVRTAASRALEPPEPSTPIVGRVAELSALDRALAERAPGRERVVMLLGEAGIGKSRVIEEFHARARARGARVLIGRSYESAQIVPFAPWVDALRRGRIADDEIARGLEPMWRREVARLLPELAQPGQDPAEAPNDAGRIFESVARLLDVLAARQPVVILLEDVHYADDMSVRLLASLARGPRRAPLVLVASVRDDELNDAVVLRTVLGELARERRLERLVLAPLSKPETLELTRHLVRVGTDAPTVAALAERLWTASKGHPFMIVETMAALDQASLPSEAAVPERVRDVILARLGRLTERARMVVDVAAVMGREFDFPLLRTAAAFDEAAAATAVEELVRRRIFRFADDRFDFGHDRIREVALAEILPPRRRMLHRQVADALHALGEGRRDRDWAVLASHCCEAGLWAGAAEAFREAGRTASVRSAEREAAACFEAALDALGHAPENRPVLEAIVDINLELRNSLLVLGEVAGIPSCLAASEAAACALGDARRQAWVSLFKGQLAWWIGVSPKARDFAEHAERTADASDDRSLRITAGLYAGFAWFHDGDAHRANLCLETALELLRGEPVHRRHGHQSLPVPMALAHLARSHALLGNGAEAVRHAREALRLAEEVGHRYSVMSALGSLGDALMTCGALDEAISTFERFAALVRDSEVGGHVTATLGYALVLSGRVREGIALFETECEAFDGAGRELFKARALATLGHAYLVAGRFQDAERRGHEALALARHRGERSAEGWALWLLAETAARQQPAAVDHASARYVEALALAGPLGHRPLMAYCHCGLGQLLRRAGHPDAEAHVRRAATLEREMGITLWLWPGETLALGPTTPVRPRRL